MLLKLIICLLPFILLCILRLVITGSGNSGNQNSSMDDYLANERKALYARNKDISGLELFTPCISSLPFSDQSASDSTLSALEQKVLSSSKEPMLDLHHMSNADIKIAYGPANFPLVSKYDQNYMYFTRDVFQWGRYLFDNNMHDKARIVLEYALELSKDMAGVYTMLAKIYIANDEIELISGLIRLAGQSDMISRQSVCNSLRELINSY